MWHSMLRLRLLAVNGILDGSDRGSASHSFADAQAEEVKRAADQVSQLRRVGKGLGVFEFDRALADVEA